MSLVLLIVLPFLSTPSGWRATRPTRAVLRSSRAISIHALRVEGDNTLKSQYYTLLNFYPRPPGGGRHRFYSRDFHWQLDFYPRPPGGGRRLNLQKRQPSFRFLSTPSGWRATRQCAEWILFAVISIHALRVEGDVRSKNALQPLVISIHALRVEGDFSFCHCTTSYYYFYPRPPGGGRRKRDNIRPARQNFYPRPPGGGRLQKFFCHRISSLISIHALRVEGDLQKFFCHRISSLISIHALRVEGDLSRFSKVLSTLYFYPRPPGGGRLFVFKQLFGSNRYFYPRPPGGGRPLLGQIGNLYRYDFYPRPPGGGRHPPRHGGQLRRGISIHALRVEGDRSARAWAKKVTISIHALRVEGDRKSIRLHGPIHRFLSTPSGWRATFTS